MSRTKIKPVENSHPTTELVVSLHVNHEEHVPRELADTGASSSIILEAYTSKDLIKQDKDSKTTCSTMNGQFTTEKTGLMSFSLPEFILKTPITWEFYVDD